MTCEIQRKANHVEVHVSGTLSHWDVLKTIHDLHKHDPHKKTPDLWVLHPELNFSMYSFPVIVQGILKLTARLMKNGCNSAILAADEFQRAELDMFCREAAVLPYEVRCFTSHGKALEWLLA